MFSSENKLEKKIIWPNIAVQCESKWNQSTWNHLTLLTRHPWILLNFCQVHLSIKKWKSWKFYPFIKFDSKIMTTWNMDLFNLDTKPLKFLSFWNCFYSAIFNRKLGLAKLIFRLGIHFHEIIPNKIYLAKKILKHICGGVLNCQNCCSSVFPSFFREL